MGAFFACYTGAMKGMAMVALVFLFSVPSLALAQTGLEGGLPLQLVPCDGTSVTGGVECNLCTFAELIQNIINLTVYLAVVGCALLVAYAGWLMLSAGGNTSQYANGKKIFGNAVVGLIIILGGWLVVDTILKSVLDEGKFGPWNRICENNII